MMSRAALLGVPGRGLATLRRERPASHDHSLIPGCPPPVNARGAARPMRRAHLRECGPLGRHACLGARRLHRRLFVCGGPDLAPALPHQEVRLAYALPAPPPTWTLLIPL